MEGAAVPVERIRPVAAVWEADTEAFRDRMVQEDDVGNKVKAVTGLAKDLFTLKSLLLAGSGAVVKYNSVHFFPASMSLTSDSM